MLTSKYLKQMVKDTILKNVNLSFSVLISIDYEETRCVLVIEVF